MDYQKFVNSICFDLQDLLWSKHGKDVMVKAEQINKLQGEGYYGITIRENDAAMGISMNLKDVFRMFEEGKSYSEIITEVADEAVAALDGRPAIQTEAIMDYELARDNIMIQVVPTEENWEMLKGIPHKEIGDISMVYRIMLDVSDHGDSSVLVSNSLLSHYGISEAQLYDDAMKNAPERFPAALRSMKEVMAEMLGVPADTLPGGPEDMFVATCNGGSRGAGCIFYPDFMKDAAEKLGGDYFVLPSSVHEVLFLRDDGSRSYHELEQMVCEVNQGEVAPQDRLSNSVYRYDSQRHQLEKAEDHQKRMQDSKNQKEHRNKDDAR